MNGGSGSQVVKTGAAKTTINTGTVKSAAATMDVTTQLNSVSTIRLNGQTTSVTIQGGTTDIYGSALNTADDSVNILNGVTTIRGGQGQLTVTCAEQSKTSTNVINAGAGNQTIFVTDGIGSTTINGALASDQFGGNQVIVGGPQHHDKIVTVAGGKTTQVIWTGQEDFIITAANSIGFYETISVYVQGGKTVFAGGSNKAVLDNQNGNLEVQTIKNTASVSVRANMAGNTVTTIGPRNIVAITQLSVMLYGFSSPDRLVIEYRDGNAYVVNQDNGSQVIVKGSIAVSLLASSSSEAKLIII